jgi:hypothetical protein
MLSSKSILETEYVPPKRPYSQNELKFLRENLYKSMNIGNIKTSHTKCYHFYFVKKNSRKEKEIKETNNNENIGNCSVCWKINKTPRNLRDRAYDLVDSYCRTFYDENYNYNYDLLDLETIFYKWLYFEGNRDKKKYKEDTDDADEKN